MKSNRELKNQALAALKGNWGKAVLVTILITLVYGLFSGPTSYKSIKMQNYVQEELGSNPSPSASISILSSQEYQDMVRGVFRTSRLMSILMILVLYPLNVGYVNSFRRLLSGETDMLENTIDVGFKNRYGIKILTMLWRGILIFLWSMLLVIPGIIKAYSYAMTPYILDDDPNIEPVDAIHRSRMMMKGHKFDLFWLQLSFIGWAILCILTCFIGFLWLAPYVQASTAAFYEEVKADYALNGGLD